MALLLTSSAAATPSVDVTHRDTVLVFLEFTAQLKMGFGHSLELYSWWLLNIACCEVMRAWVIGWVLPHLGLRRRFPILVLILKRLVSCLEGRLALSVRKNLIHLSFCSVNLRLHNQNIGLLLFSHRLHAKVRWVLEVISILLDAFLYNRKCGVALVWIFLKPRLLDQLVLFHHYLLITR